MSKTVAKALNPYLSNLTVNFTKLHNLHWNVKGKEFIRVHEFTESMYDEMAEKLDEVAEKIIMQGESPANNLEDYLSMATIKECKKDLFSVDEVLSIVLEDVNTLKDQVKALRNEFDEAGLFSVVMMLEDHYAYYEKQVWFLKSMLV